MNIDFEEITQNTIFSFTWKERLKILFFGKVILSDISFKKASNYLLMLIFQINEKFKNDAVKQRLNIEGDERNIETE